MIEGSADAKTAKKLRYGMVGGGSRCAFIGGVQKYKKIDAEL